MPQTSVTVWRQADRCADCTARAKIAPSNTGRHRRPIIAGQRTTWQQAGSRENRRQVRGFQALHGSRDSSDSASADQAATGAVIDAIQSSSS